VHAVRGTSPAVHGLRDDQPLRMLRPHPGRRCRPVHALRRAHPALRIWRDQQSLRLLLARRFDSEPFSADLARTDVVLSTWLRLTRLTDHAESLPISDGNGERAQHVWIRACSGRRPLPAAREPRLRFHLVAGALFPGGRYTSYSRGSAVNLGGFCGADAAVCNLGTANPPPPGTPTAAQIKASGAAAQAAQVASTVGSYLLGFAARVGKQYVCPFLPALGAAAGEGIAITFLSPEITILPGVVITAAEFGGTLGAQVGLDLYTSLCR